MPAKSIPTNGAAIRAVREAKKLSREEVATSALISASALANIENGYRDSTPAVLQRIADRLDVPLAAVVRCRLPDYFHKEADRRRQQVAVWTWPSKPARHGLPHRTAGRGRTSGSKT